MSPPERSIFNDPDPEADTRRLAEAEADIAAGRVVPHERVVAWLKSWGTADELPCPKWDDLHGPKPHWLT